MKPVTISGRSAEIAVIIDLDFLIRIILSS
jgi:hypothetical protein